MPLKPLTTGAALHYEALGWHGRRAPIILLHGLLGTARSHLGAAMDWLAARGLPVIGLTLRGYGDSLPKPRDFPDNFYHRDCADLFAFMDALDCERAHLLGYSDGGEVALIAAGSQPQRIASCIAIGAVGNFGAEMRPIFQRLYPGDWITEAEKRLHGFDDAARFTGGWARAMTRMLDAGGDVSLSLAPRIRCPLLIMLGRADQLNPQHNGEIFANAAPNGALAMFDCGHAVQDEVPAAFYARALAHLRAAYKNADASR